MRASICAFGALLAMIFSTPSVGTAASMSAADYIKRVKVKMKPGLYSGVNAEGASCSVTAALGRNGRVIVYEVTVDPTIENQSAPAGPTIVRFGSKDPRVLYDAALERAVNNYGNVYLVLGITRHSSGKTLIRAYEERGVAIRAAECLVDL